MKKTIGITVLMAFAGLFIASCQNNGGDAEGFKQTESGLLYKYFEKSDNTELPQESNILTLSMTYGSADSIVFDSKQSPMPMELPLMKSVYKGDLYEGLSMMHIGDSAVFKCNADSVFTKLFRLQSPPPGLESADFIYFNIKMLDFKTQEEMQAAREAEMEMLKSEETVKRNTYLDEHYPDAKPSASGLYYIQLEKGNGEKPVAGKKVKVHYTGTLLDGTKFDSSVDRGQPFEFELGKGRVIKGWDEGIANMSKGEKGILVIPSDLAYGPGNRGIPPFATLVFEVELIDFEK
ncbi:MAG: FKBP-type peptidyl-prolyl cis-trans isomerase [Bacteroidales bacterium]|nr:FKBP-type peptidyl-prolyl cis-trans isomerase [Bacteroidales bacterium]MCF6342542.1 FKBP-type peptidyl-prolyl cis-trans isomerase [Bacteroidales bacterium]